MLNKILCFIILGVFAGLTPAGAQTAPTAPARVKGKIVAARVQGHVEAILEAGGVPRVLHDGDQLTDQTKVVTSAGANVILVFSNGATVDVSEDSTLDIEQFEQDPFSADLNMGALKAEPGTSTTKLNLAKGELVGKVVHLNIDKGSEFTVQTPVGAAGIRGTIFKIVFRTGRDGKTHFVVTTLSGTVVYKGTTAAPISIPAGKTVTAVFSYTPPSGNGGSTGTGTGTGGTGTGGTGTGGTGTGGTGTGGTGTGGTGDAGTGSTSNPVAILSDTTPTESAEIETQSQAIVTATQVTSFNGNTGGTGTGGTGTGGTGTGGTGTGGTGTGGTGTGGTGTGGTDNGTGTGTGSSPPAPPLPGLSNAAG